MRNIFIILFLYFVEVFQPVKPLNYILLIFCVASFYFSFSKKRIEYIGLLIPLLNGISRILNITFFPSLVMVVGFSVFGFLLTSKEKIDFDKKNGIDIFVKLFFILNLISGIFYISELIYPKISFFVNNIGLRNFDLINYIVLYLVVLNLSVYFYLFSKKNLLSFNEFIFCLATGSIVSYFIAGFEAVKTNFGIRTSGLFTDFNSLGIFAGMTSMLFIRFSLLEKDIKKYIFIASGISGAAATILSGSRSGLLILVLSYGISILYFTKRIKRMLFIVLSILFFLFLTHSKFLKFKYNSPIGRLIAPFVSFERLKWHIVEYRKVFWNVGWMLFKKSPIVGCGIKNFFANFSNFTRMRISDNACNQYLSYLINIGILGFTIFISIILIFFAVFKYIKFDEKKLSIYFILASFFLSSFWGSHLEASEVSFLFWIYLGYIFQNIKLKVLKRDKIFFNIFVLLFVLLNIPKTISKIRVIDIFKYSKFAGFYDIERNKNCKFRWSGKYGFIKLRKNKSGYTEIKFYNPKPLSTKVILYLNEKIVKKIKFEPGEMKKIKLHLDKDENVLKLVVNKLYIPAGGFIRYLFPFHGRDYRNLGIAVIL